MFGHYFVLLFVKYIHIKIVSYNIYFNPLTKFTPFFHLISIIVVYNLWDALMLIILHDDDFVFFFLVVTGVFCGYVLFMFVQLLFFLSNSLVTREIHLKMNKWGCLEFELRPLHILCIIHYKWAKLVGTCMFNDL